MHGLMYTTYFASDKEILLPTQSELITFVIKHMFKIYTHRLCNELLEKGKIKIDRINSDCFFLFYFKEVVLKNKLMLLV